MLWDRFSKKWAMWFNWVAMVTLVVMFVLSVFDIVGAKLFSFPVPGSIDLLGLLLLLVGALALAQTEVLRQHVRVDFVLMRLPKRVKAICVCVNSIVAIAVIILVIWASYLYSIDLYEKNVGSMTLFIPLFPYPFILAVACLPMLLVFTLELVEAVREASRSGLD